MRIYVAGPITHGDQFLNVRKALNTASALFKMGHQPFVPHLTCFWHLIHVEDYERWMEYDLKWIDVCEGVFRIDGYSPGADRETAYAVSKDIPVYYKLEDVPS